jgi:hypothetical protein
MIVVNPSALASGAAAQMILDVNNVKPAGIFWTLVQSASIVWSAADGTWSSADGDDITWAQSSTVPT